MKEYKSVWFTLRQSYYSIINPLKLKIKGKLGRVAEE
jgi:hypothetical protein